MEKIFASRQRRLKNIGSIVADATKSLLMPIPGVETPVYTHIAANAA
jgi:hypothetical protein